MMQGMGIKRKGKFIDDVIEIQISKWSLNSSVYSTIIITKKLVKKDGDDKLMIILPPKGIEDKIKFMKMTLWLLMALNSEHDGSIGEYESFIQNREKTE